MADPYNIGLWQNTEQFLPDQFMPLVDWNVRAWLDDGKGMIDDSVLEGDEDAKKKVKNQQWELVKEVCSARWTRRRRGSGTPPSAARSAGVVKPRSG